MGYQSPNFHNNNPWGIASYPNKYNFSSPEVKSFPKESSRHHKCKSLSESKKHNHRLDDVYYCQEGKAFGKKKNQNRKKKQRGGSTKNLNTEGHKFTWKYEIQIDDKDFQVGK